MTNIAEEGGFWNLAPLCARSVVRPLLLGQFLSVLLCGTGVFSGLLQNQHVNLPTGKTLLHSLFTRMSDGLK